MSKNSKKTTITDVAQKVGMTTITVSRALNTPEKVKKATLDKILAAAQELNYVPNAIARNLKSQQSRIIGLVTASIDNPFYANTFKAINRVAKQHNYSLMLFDTDGSEELEQTAIETLMSYQASGIILSAVSDSPSYIPSYLNKLKLANIPVVQIDRNIHAAEFPGVYLDNLHSGYKGMQKLLEQGYKKVLILAGPESSTITLERIEGIKQAIQDSQQEIELIIKYGDYQGDGAKSAMADVLTQHAIAEHDLPEAIFGLNILITIRAMEALQDAGLGIERFGLISIDHIPYGHAFGKSVPCIRHDTYELGLTAVQMLITKINHKDTPIEDKIIVGEYSND